MNSKFIIGILIFFFILSLALLYRNPLQSADSSLYALTAKNLVISKTWLPILTTPGDLSSYLDKPPLFIWFLASCMKMTGISEIAVHLPNIFLFFLLGGIIYCFASRFSNKKVALLTSFFFLTNLTAVVFSRTPLAEMLLTLFITLASFNLYCFLENSKDRYLYLFSAFVALGFLTKSGLGLLPVITALTFFIFLPKARKTLLDFMLSYKILIAAFCFLIVVSPVLFATYKSLGSFGPEFIKYITQGGKFGGSYLKLGIHPNILLYLLLAGIPWAPLFLCSLEYKGASRKLDLSTFSLYWIGGYTLFFLFIYNFTEVRSMVIFVPPIAILCALKLSSILDKPTPHNKLWGISLAYSLLYIIILALLILSPQKEFNLLYAIAPVSVFFLASLIFSVFVYNRKITMLYITIFFVIAAYGVLFYTTKPLVASTHPENDRCWQLFTLY